MPRFFKERILSIQPVQGGSINETFLVKTSANDFFIKRNSSSLHSMFEQEKEGLTLLKHSETFKIPEVIALHSDQDYSYLILEYLHNNLKNNNWENFGRKLATLHKNSSSHFGWRQNNFIGTLIQSNRMHKDWIEFYVEERLLPLGKEVQNKYNLPSSFLKDLHSFCGRVGAFFPDESPSLLHGDLWSGNCFFDSTGTPCVFDPAVYYGHREMEIAMTLLFGGFPSEMYHAYHETYPLEKGWETRMKTHQLYPLLVHLLLFGTSYLKSVEEIIKK